MKTTRLGFTFVEILIGIIIMVIGLVPLMLAYGAATSTTRVSISQIQAINHAANLMEAMRAYGAQDFKNLTSFPPAMEQRKGGDNVWVPLTGDDPLLVATAAAAGTPAPAFTGADTSGTDQGQADKNFTAFKTAFMSGDNPVVAKLEARFKRSFQTMKHGGYVTLIVRVGWAEEDLAASNKPQDRMIELRTVVADPYMPSSRFNRGGRRSKKTSGTPDDGGDSGDQGDPPDAGGDDSDHPAAPKLPPMPRLGSTRQ